MIRYTLYYPQYDAVNNCGFRMDVDDFKPGAFGSDPDVDELPQGTQHCPTEPCEDPDGGHLGDCIALGVECVGDGGFTYAALRKAADAYRTEHKLGPPEND